MAENTNHVTRTFLEHTTSSDVAAAMFELAKPTLDLPLRASVPLPSEVVADAVRAPVHAAITAALSGDDPAVLAKHAKSPRVTQRRAVAQNPAISDETAVKLLAESLEKGDFEMMQPLLERLPAKLTVPMVVSESSAYRHQTRRLAGTIGVSLRKSSDPDDLLAAASSHDEELPTLALLRAHALESTLLFEQVAKVVAGNRYGREAAAQYLRRAPAFGDMVLVLTEVFDIETVYAAMRTTSNCAAAAHCSAAAFDALFRPDGVAVSLLATSGLPDERIDRLIPFLALNHEPAVLVSFMNKNGELVTCERVAAFLEHVPVFPGVANRLLKVDGVLERDDLVGTLVAGMVANDAVTWFRSFVTTPAAAARAAQLILDKNVKGHVTTAPVFNQLICWDTFTGEVADAVMDSLGAELVRNFAAGYTSATKSLNKHVVRRVGDVLGEHVEAWEFVAQMMPDWESSLSELLETATVMFEIPTQRVTNADTGDGDAGEDDDLGGAGPEGEPDGDDGGGTGGQPCDSGTCDSTTDADSDDNVAEGGTADASLEEADDATVGGVDAELEALVAADGQLMLL